VREACWLLKPWGREGRVELRALRRPVRRALLECLDNDDVTIVATARRKLVLLPAPSERE
jgi:hypothetical protein